MALESLRRNKGKREGEKLFKGLLRKALEILFVGILGCLPPSATLWNKQTQSESEKRNQKKLSHEI